MVLKIGTAGVPISSKGRSTIDGIKKVRELGLDAMEIEFVRGCKMSPEMAQEVRKTAEKNNIVLTVHAPYYINLNSSDQKKWHASIARVLRSAKIGNIAGAVSVTFHPGYYQGKQPQEVYKRVREALLRILSELKHDKNRIKISLETTGKVGAFGTLQEILELSKEFEQIHPCIDFAHLWARQQGKIDFTEILEQIEKVLGKKELRDMHIHFSGIEYTQKGERNHLNFAQSKFPYKQLAAALREFNVSGVAICESPNLEGDALIFQKLLQ